MEDGVCGVGLIVMCNKKYLNILIFKYIFTLKKNLTPHPPLTHQSYGDIFMQLIVWKVGLLLMCIPIHTINCLKSWTINYMCTYSYNQWCEKLGYYSYGHVLVQLIVRRIRNMIVHMRVLFILVSSIVWIVVPAIVSMNILEPILPPIFSQLFLKRVWWSQVLTLLLMFAFCCLGYLLD